MSKLNFSTVDITIDGELLPIAPGASLDKGGVERKGNMGDKALLGFTETYKPSTVKCVIPLRRGEATLEMIKDATDATISFRTDTGQQYLVRNAFSTITHELKAGDAGVACEFEGDPAELV